LRSSVMAAFRIPVSAPNILPEDADYVRSVLSENQASGRSPVVKQFEEAFSRYLGTKHAVACSNGTAALHLAVKSLGLREGDEVIVPALTMMSPVFALLYEGVRPRLVDVDRTHWVATPSAISKAVTKKTKAVLVVHLYGNPVEIDEVREMADRHGLFVIEDCAEALGATYRGRRVGNLGDASCFSFFANKLITCGEGGMVVTNDDEVGSKLVSYHDLCFGRKNKFLHESVGYNYRISAPQAALGLSQLRRIDEHLIRIRRIAGWYASSLRGVSGLELHTEPPNAVGSYWMYSVVVSGGQAVREKVAERLSKDGIETRPFFVPAHRQPACARLFSGESYPVSEYLSERGLNLPSGLGLTEGEVAAVCESLKRALS
jgi:perosamine synthetase